jgi:Flp pilus assembly protein TadG
MTAQIGGRGPAMIERRGPLIKERWTRGSLSPMRAEGGNAAIEFALVTPILIGLLVPVADPGMAFSRQVKVRQAAQGGTQYCAADGWDSTSVPPGKLISNAVTAAMTRLLGRGGGALPQQ